MMGQKEAILVDQNVGAGAYVTEWNSMNNSGAIVKEGIYFYRLEAERVGVKKTITRKMVKLK